MGKAHDATFRTWDAENLLTLKALRAVPSKGLEFRPHRLSRSLGELAWHLVESERWFCTEAMKLPGRKVGAKAPATGGAIAAAREATHAELSAAVRKKGDAWLSAEVEFYGMKMTRAGIVSLMVRHDAHHRGQLSVYLRLVGAKVPGIYGPSADEERAAKDGEEE